MKIKSREGETRRKAIGTLRSTASRRWVAIGYTLVVFVAGVAAHRLGVLRGAIDLLSPRTITTITRRVQGLTTTPERLIIDIKHKDFMNLAHQREVALKRQVLIVSDNDVVNANVRFAGKTIPVKLRLKGDLTDHLEGDKWSFRIIARSDSTILGMKQFSLQHPQTRDFINERRYHEAMRREGLLALRYDFVDVTINGKDLGLYALEEVFETRLVENNERKDGPILRFNEDVLWGELARQESVAPRDRGFVAGSGGYFSADIDAFQTSKWLATPAGRDQFLTAIQLLSSFRTGKVTVAEAFDIKKLATFFALSDLFSAWHGVGNWPNARFYYNPITSRLEPVSFDAYNRTTPAKPGLLALQAIDERRDPTSRRYISQFFADTAFYRLYVSELERVSAAGYVDEMQRALAPKLDPSLKMLRREFPELEIDWQSVRRAAEFIRIALHPPQAVQTYLRTAAPGELVMDVANMQALPLRIIGLARDTTVLPSTPQLLGGKDDSQPMQFTTIRFPVPRGFTWPNDTLETPLRVRYQVVGSQQIDEAPAMAWSHEGLGDSQLRATAVRQAPNAASFPFIRIDDTERRIAILPGSWRVDRDLVFPSGYRVFAGPGTRLDIVNKANVLSWSAVDLRGEQDKPIVIESSDRTGQGFIVLQAGEMSTLDHVQFFGLSNAKQSGWEMTGAVEFYESPVTIRNSRFSKNRSEDALHIMRAAFVLDGVVFDSTQADALDIDFGKGPIRNSRFLDVGNDGIDASGSVVEVEDVQVKGAGDKGISAGEGSTLTAKRIDVRDAAIGIASKDRSHMMISDAHIIGGQVGVTAYRKKSEYGPGIIEFTTLEIKGQKVAYLIEQGSSLKIDGRAMPADLTNVADKLYGAEFGKASR